MRVTAVLCGTYSLFRSEELIVYCKTHDYTSFFVILILPGKTSWTLFS